MADASTPRAGMMDGAVGFQQLQPEQHLVFLLDVDALSSQAPADASHASQANNNHHTSASAYGGRPGDDKLVTENVPELQTRISQVFAQLNNIPTAVSYGLISSKSKFIYERISKLKVSVASSSCPSGVVPATTSGNAGNGKISSPRTPRDIHWEMRELLIALRSQSASAGGPAAASGGAATAIEGVASGAAAAPATAAACSTWLDTVTHHVQQSASRYVAAMQAA
ncbi:hypothetical protein Agub_g11594, partial [Astrephomene gubernaculifera]